MKKGSTWVCEGCGLELEVVKECDECGEDECCSGDCTFECCGETLTLKE